uniref:MD-2-related lipid-recognition domain-containing protein n=1 Tax=Branchiostoma floridae TaxID=7739 RepID=C3ZXS3_BRAFL|eukprot:XP_002586664.1 hypothetical protein BRAFLDRAFT_131176 [Branchiostoma floridae]
MLAFFFATIALAAAQFDQNYQFGNLNTPINQALIFDCGSNPDRALRNPKFVFSRDDLELPGSFTIIDAEIEVAKPINRPLYGKIDAWRTIYLFGGAASTIQLGCFYLSGKDYGVGSCDYGELCGLLDLNTPVNNMTGELTCYEEAMNLGIPEDQCTCEGIAPKVYSLSNWYKEVDLTDLESGVLTFLAQGDYEIKMTATDASGAEQACIGIRVPVKEYEDPNATDSGWFFGKRKRSAKLL